MELFSSLVADHSRRLATLAADALFRPRLNSNKGTKCDIESRATRMLAGVQLRNPQFLSALAPSLTASFALRPGDRSESS